MEEASSPIAMQAGKEAVLRRIDGDGDDAEMQAGKEAVLRRIDGDGDDAKIEAGMKAVLRRNDDDSPKPSLREYASFRLLLGDGDSAYTPFPGIVLTDTFNMTQEKKLIDENSKRAKRQRDKKIRIIIGNPPYSAGQKSENDGNKNTKYPYVDEQIQQTYAAHSTATNKNSLYDSYIRAFRWASDRIGDCGVIAFVTNGGWLDGNAMDGFRKCLAEEFTDIYCFNLRGNQRTQGEVSRKEGGKIFGSGSRAPIVITLLVKNPMAAGSKWQPETEIFCTQKIGVTGGTGSKWKPETECTHGVTGIGPVSGGAPVTPNRSTDSPFPAAIDGSSGGAPVTTNRSTDSPFPASIGAQCRIHYYDIGDYLDREEKLQILRDAKSIAGIEWEIITPNEKYDWINQRGEDFDSFIPLGDKKNPEEQTVFENYSRGLETARDSWCYNFSRKKLTSNMKRMIAFYNEQVEVYQEHKQYNGDKTVEQFIDNDGTKISWSRSLKRSVDIGAKITHKSNSITLAVYRPFCKVNAYFNRCVNNVVGPLSNFFPEPGMENMAICVEAPGGKTDFSCFMSDTLPDLHLFGATQCFPFYTYERVVSEPPTLVGGLIDGDTDWHHPPTNVGGSQYIRRENISDAILEKFREHYKSRNGAYSRNDGLGETPSLRRSTAFIPAFIGCNCCASFPSLRRSTASIPASNSGNSYYTLMIRSFPFPLSTPPCPLTTHKS